MVGFKDIKSIGGPPEFQEMLKKLVAQSNTDQEGAALIVNKQGEVKTEEKSVKAEEKNQISKIKKSITEQSRKIISLSNLEKQLISSINFRIPLMTSTNV